MLIELGPTTFVAHWKAIISILIEKCVFVGGSHTDCALANYHVQRGAIKTKGKKHATYLIVIASALVWHLVCLVAAVAQSPD